jgi:hypothetical protein
VDVFVSPKGGLGVRAARHIPAGTTYMIVDRAWALDYLVALADPVMGPVVEVIGEEGTGQCYK